MANSFAAKTPFQRGSAFEDTLTDEEVMIALQEQERQRQPFGGPLSAVQAQQAVAPFANSAVMGMQGAPTLPMPETAPSAGALAPPQESLPGQNRLNQFLSSPGFAMASAALNNIGSGRPNARGQYQNPIAAMQMAQRQNQALLMQKAKLADDRLQRERQQELRELQMQKARRDLDPMADFNDFVKQRDISDKPYEEQLGEYRDYMTAGMKTASLPASVQTMMYMESQLGRPLTSQERWEVLRAPTTYNIGGGGVEARSPGGGTEVLVSPEDATERDAALAGAKEQAKSDVQVATEQAEQLRQNETTWAAYQSGMQGLSDALGSTWTGTIGGLLPAITQNQQKTDAAIALMAPLLKNIFRDAGEGTFTKDDQEILMEMLPDRGTKGPVVAYIIEQVDNIVRSKLRVNEMDLGSTDGY